VSVLMLGRGQEGWKRSEPAKKRRRRSENREKAPDSGRRAHYFHSSESGWRELLVSKHNKRIRRRYKMTSGSATDMAYRHENREGPEIGKRGNIVQYVRKVARKRKSYTGKTTNIIKDKR